MQKKKNKGLLGLPSISLCVVPAPLSVLASEMTKEVFLLVARSVDQLQRLWQPGALDLDPLRQRVAEAAPSLRREHADLLEGFLAGTQSTTDRSGVVAPPSHI